MPSHINDVYTLLIPTYNRPKNFERLVTYLSRRNVGFQIIVLDSSRDEAALEANAEVLSGTNLNVRYARFDPDMEPFVKFAEGLKLVTTPYCSFCADDDILFTDRIQDCVDFLEENPFYVGAHGYYVNFIEEDVFKLTYAIQTGSSIAGDNALKRLAQQLRYYDVIFYPVYRTEVAQRAQATAAQMGILLFMELVGSSMSLIEGGVARLDSFFLARNTDQSLATDGWHPHEMLPKGPERMFREYLTYRKPILDALARDTHLASTYDEEKRKRIVDLMHLRYLAPMLDQTILDFMIDGSIAHDEPAEIVKGVWDRWVYSGQTERPKHPRRAYPPSRLDNFLRRLKVWLSEEKLGRRMSEGKPPSDWLNPHTDRYVDEKTANGDPRRYLVYDELIYQALPTNRHISPEDVRAMISHLNDYI
ncbi:TIGR00180 family glycosyltransferase [Magnetovibrio sp.]|uniref:TIGR00180 family glycosyltransferase n=1 Tax=Magnetovibrio sp. TaxID=2024836 RepID=UPI002F94B7B9